MRIKKLGDIVLTHSLTWLEYDNVPNVDAEVEETINGGVIVWEQLSDISSENISLSSENTGWQDVTTKELIKTLVSTSIGSTTTITLTDDTVINVRFRHEEEGGAVNFTRVIDAYLSEYYTCNIFLAKV